MEQIVYILIGWFLGLLGPVISDRIKIEHNRKKFFKAIRVELHDLQFRVLVVCHMLKGKYGTIDRDYLEWIKPIVDNYKGNEPKESTVKAVYHMLNADEKEFNDILNFYRAKPGQGSRLKIFSSVFLESNPTLISELPTDLQIKIHECRNRLNILNQEIIEVNDRFKMTFDTSISDENRELISSGLAKEYLFIQGLTKDVVDKIGVVTKSTLKTYFIFDFSQIIWEKIQKKIKSI